jgi:hypothetical protein
MEKIDFDNVIEETLSALEFGYSLGELVWTRDKYEGKQVVCLEQDRAPRPARAVSEIDAHGNYIGVKQLSMGQDINLTPEKTFLYSHNKRFGNIYGESDLALLLSLLVGEEVHHQLLERLSGAHGLAHDADEVPDRRERQR